jgi:hypothetical protein
MAGRPRKLAVVAGGADPRAALPAVRKVKRAVGGNSPCDQAWMEAEADSLTEIPTADIPTDVWWDVKYMWDGESFEVNPDFFTEWERSKRKCSGQAYIRDERGGYILDREWTRLMRQCLTPPLNGSDVCAKHGGEIGHVKAAAQRRLGMAAERAAETLINMTRTRDETNELIDHKVRVQAANSVLDRTGIKSGSEVEVTIPGYKRVLEKLFSDDAKDEE